MWAINRTLVGFLATFVRMWRPSKQFYAARRQDCPPPAFALVCPECKGRNCFVRDPQASSLVTFCERKAM